MIELIDEPREFSVDELFFSTTDPKGRILRANSVFQRISAYSWDDLKNSPHNIIRHPDMPRVIFQLLWDYIQSGRPIVAFVKNLAQDKRYYWVVALIVPAADGYLSVRFKPTSPAFVTVKQLYAELRALEASIENESSDRKAAMAASKELLATKLHALGFGDYDDFMQQVLKQEMQSREERMRDFASPLADPRLSRAGAEITGAEAADLESLRTSARMFDNLLDVLNVLFRDLESYATINKGVRIKSDNVTDIAESLRVSALNGAIEADKLGSNAVGLRPVLDWLRTFSGEITNDGARLSNSLVELIKDVDRVVFGLSAAKLQIEMTARFAHELVGSGVAGRSSEVDPMTGGAITCLHACSCETVRMALKNLAGVKETLKGLTGSQHKLLEASRFLRPLYLTGKIEMADGAGPKLAMVFRDVSDQMNETVTNLNGLNGLLEDLAAHLLRGLAHGRRVDDTIAQIDSHLNMVPQLSF